ncbi:MAG: hypothetical protein LBG52_00085 [Candidatus Peribacteria bacterium]|jgi:hypothetical protein|nr:hypothetical protein [Candidatus Peribacteria bacterium]
MKKFTLYTTFFLGSFILIFFLSACSIPEYTQSEIASLYQKQFQSTTTSLQDVFATLPEHYQSITQLQLTLPTDAIQGNVTYQSIKNIQDTAEKSTISLNGNLKDLKNNLPLQFSGAFLMFYTGKQMYFSIQDFFLFMGSGNAEAKFITLFAQQLAHKRIALDQQDTIRVDIIEIPTYREILEHFLNLYTPLTPTFTQVPDIKNTFEGKISTLSPAYLTSLKTVIQLISD